MNNFTKEEIEALKELAQEKIFQNRMTRFDEKGNPIPYRNRYSIEPPNLIEEEVENDKKA